MNTNPDEDNLDREPRVLLDLGANPSRKEIYEALQKIGIANLYKNAVGLFANETQEEALRVINEQWIPELNAWVDEQCNHIMRVMDQPDAPTHTLN
jgi:hypothetical protein